MRSRAALKVRQLASSDRSMTCGTSKGWSGRHVRELNEWTGIQGSGTKGWAEKSLCKTDRLERAQMKHQAETPTGRMRDKKTMRANEKDTGRPLDRGELQSGGFRPDRLFVVGSPCTWADRTVGTGHWKISLRRLVKLKIDYTLCFSTDDHRSQVTLSCYSNIESVA